MRYVTGYHCWRVGRETYLIICTEQNLKATEVIYAYESLEICAVDVNRPLPDIRLHYPVKFAYLPPRLRAAVRAYWQGKLGEERCRQNVPGCSCYRSVPVCE